LREDSNAGKAKLQKFYLLTLDFTYLKTCNLLTLTSRCGKFNYRNMYQALSESASFCKRHDKKLVFFGSQFCNFCSLAKRKC